jgi:hypothetical protein
MKVAFITRSTLYAVPGGDTEQILQTAWFLKELGVREELFEIFNGFLNNGKGKRLFGALIVSFAIHQGMIRNIIEIFYNIIDFIYYENRN